MEQPKVRSLPARSAAASSGESFGKESDSGPAGAARLSQADLGARISMLFRIHDDPEHPFSEVVGVLQRVEPAAGSKKGSYQVVRRNGEMVAVPENDLIKFRILGQGAVRET